MRPLRALVIYIVVVFVGGALLAPWLYWLAQAFAHSFPKIAAEPFNRFVDRSLLILALAGLWPLLRALGVTSWREAGVVRPPRPVEKTAGRPVGRFRFPGHCRGSGFRLRQPRFQPNRNRARGGRNHFQRHGRGRRRGGHGGDFVSRRRVRRVAQILLLAAGARHQQHDLCARSFSAAGGFCGAVNWHSGLVLLPRMLGGFVDFQALVPGFFQSDARRRAAGSGLSAHRQSLFLHRPSRRLGFLAENLRRVHRHGAARLHVVLGHQQND